MTVIPCVGDIDGDGNRNCRRFGRRSSLCVACQRLWRRRLAARYLTFGKGTPLLANLDDDLLPEVLAGDLSGTLYVWNVDHVSYTLKLFLPLITRTP